MQKILNRIRPIYLMIGAFMTALMLTMDFKLCTSGKEYTTALSGIFDDLFASMDNKSFVATVIFIAIFYLATRDFIKEVPCKIGVAILSVIVAFIWVLGESFIIDDSFVNLTSSYGQMIKSMIFFIGSYNLVYLAVALFYYLINKEYNTKQNILDKLLEKHYYITIVGILVIGWIIPVIICYPAFMNSDTWFQLFQYYGYSDLTAHHPAVATLTVGLLTKICGSFGNSSVGLYFIVLFQFAVYVSVVTYSFSLIRKLKGHKWITYLYLVMCVLSPYYANRVNVPLKDGLFALANLLFIIEIIYALIDIDAFIKSKRHYILSFIAIAGTLLMRHNGAYVLYPTILIFAIIVIVKRKDIHKEYIVRITALVLITIVFSNCLEAGLKKATGMQNGAFTEALSLPAQQIARTVKKYDAVMTDEEKEAINNVIEYDELVHFYEPYIADPVKGLYYEDISKSDLKKYLVTWVKMFFKYPDTYIAAFLNQNFYLIYPFEENNVVYNQFFIGHEDRMAPLKDNHGFKDSTAFYGAQEFAYFWNNFWYASPVLGMMAHPAVPTLLLLAMLVLSFKNRKTRRFLIVATPLIFSIFIILLAPVIQYASRYAFPIIYSIPVCITYFAYLNRHGDGEK